jgi:hypothetical protein
MALKKGFELQAEAIPADARKLVPEADVEELILFTTTTCPNCSMAKDFLNITDDIFETVTNYITGYGSAIFSTLYNILLGLFFSVYLLIFKERIFTFCHKAVAALFEERGRRRIMLFATTLNISNILGSAPSASIMQVGDMGAEENDFEVPFTPRIVCYKGMKSLPKGESWGVASRIDKYPYAAFVDEEAVNLCFEERNGIEGLCRYHLPTLLRQRDCRKITLDLYLTTAEIATLFTREGSKPSLLSKFRFNIQGESQLFRLAKIDSWDTESNIVRCTFEQD